MGNTPTTTPPPTWFGHRELLPVLELADAYARLADPSTLSDPDDDATVELRMRRYADDRCGWSAQTWRWNRDGCLGHDEAVARVLATCACAHDLVRDRDFEATNRMCGTGARGWWARCTKCGHEQRVVTAQQRWSGD